MSQRLSGKTSRTHAIIRRCSSGSSRADSPVEPATTTPSSPAATRRLTLLRRWTGATSPVAASNGVVMGASTPASCGSVTARSPAGSGLRGGGGGGGGGGGAGRTQRAQLRLQILRVGGRGGRRLERDAVLLPRPRPLRGDGREAV